MTFILAGRHTPPIQLRVADRAQNDGAMGFTRRSRWSPWFQPPADPGTSGITDKTTVAVEAGDMIDIRTPGGGSC